MGAKSMLLDGKVAIITGAGSGIGRASALLFAQKGAQVALLDVDIEGGTQTHDEIGEQNALFIETDMRNAEQVEAAVAQTVDRFGKLDAIFNVVGMSGRRWGDGPIAECTEDAWDRVMEINLKSMFLGSKYAVQQMLKQGHGVVINLSSVLGLVGGDADFATHAYAASKSGIIGMTRAIAAYYADQNIRANVICPGLIATAMSQRAQSNDHIIRKLKHLQPLTGDFGQPEDVAGAALYLASDHARFVTGAVLTVDGGWTVH
jgi:NAD(P)-dependent dehydrogenase (short-subunit alcohol dehydrogenase family)